MVLVALGAAASLLSQAASPSCAVAPHARVRSAATELTAAIVGGCRCSETFRRIVARLELSADVVYVTWARNGTLPRLVEAAFLPNVTAAPDASSLLHRLARPAPSVLANST